MSRSRWKVVAGGIALGMGLALAAAGWSWIGGDPARLLEEARRDLAAGRHDRAEAALARRERAWPGAPEDPILRARVALARGRVEEALGRLEKVPDGDPRALEAALLAGRIELRRDRARGAESSFRRAVGCDPRSVEALRELAFIAALQLRRADCDARFRALAEAAPLGEPFASVWCQVGLGIWDPGEVGARAARFVAADAEDRRSRLAWAEALRRQGRAREALAALDPLPDSDREAAAARALLALERGDPATARALATPGPEGDPALGRIRGRLAQLRRDWPAAIVAYRSAVAADPDDHELVRGLGQSLAAAGRKAEALPWLDRARRLEALRDRVASATLSRSQMPAGSEDPRRFHEIGAACEAVGWIPRAVVWYRLALARDPVDREAQRALFRLAPEGRDRATGPAPRRTLTPPATPGNPPST